MDLSGPTTRLYTAALNVECRARPVEPTPTTKHANRPTDRPTEFDRPEVCMYMTEALGVGGSGAGGRVSGRSNPTADSRVRVEVEVSGSKARR